MFVEGCFLSEDKISLHFRIRIGDKEIEVTGATEYVKQLLERLVPNYLETQAVVGPKGKAPPTVSEVPGIEQTDSGPVITSPKKGELSQVEVLGLLLYASLDHASTSKDLIRLTKGSGVDVPVTARLTIMKGRVVHLPDKRWKLSVQGEKWVETEILPKL